MKEITPETTRHYRYMRCQNGCIHLVCGNLMLALSEEQFLALFDSASEVYDQLQTEAAVASPHIHSTRIVM